jgi:hypothetical protein
LLLKYELKFTILRDLGPMQLIIVTKAIAAVFSPESEMPNDLLPCLVLNIFFSI